MTKVQVIISQDREGITFGLPPDERDKYPHGRSRVFIAFGEAPSLTLLTPQDTAAIGSLLTKLPETEVDVGFLKVNRVGDYEPA